MIGEKPKEIPRKRAKRQKEVSDMIKQILPERNSSHNCNIKSSSYYKISEAQNAKKKLQINNVSKQILDEKKDLVKFQHTLGKPMEPKKTCLDYKNVTFSPALQGDERKCLCEDHFKVSVENDITQITKLTNTASGTLAIELDKTTIEQIEQKLHNAESLTVSLSKTASGHIVMNFSSRNSSENSQKFHVSRSSSGTIMFEVDKQLVNVLETNSNTSSKQSSVFDTKSSNTDLQFIKEMNEVFNKTEKLFEKIVVPHHQEQVDRTKSKVYNNIFQKLKIIAEDSRRKNVNIKETNGSLTPFEAIITTTEPGKPAFLSNDKARLGMYSDTIERCKEFPILMIQSPSGSYISDVQSIHPNATTIKTFSGNILVVEDGPIKSNDTTNSFCTRKQTKEMFEVCVKDSQQKVTSLPVMLKSTPSQNYLVVIDKEFETCYKRTIKENLDSVYQCPIAIIDTPSGNFMLNYNDSMEYQNVNAYVVRNSLGDIKILRDPKGERVSMTPNAPDTKRSSKPLGNLISTLCSKSKKAEKNISLQKPRVLETKSSSDSNLYEKVRISLQNQDNLFSEPSALLKKTSSGQYSVVLNKQSKKSLINNLKTYLARYSNGLIPIKRTDSGEITIILNNDHVAKGQYGSLKITPSGNIYVLVKEEIIQNMVTNQNMKKPVNNQGNMEKTEQYVNKNITTTCNAMPHSCSCDSTKCVCVELIKHGVNKSYYDCQSAKCSLKYCQPIGSNACDCEFKCDHQTCSSKRISDIISNGEKSPHIVIKPSLCNLESQNKPKSDSSPLYYFTETVCPFHKNRYESVSNELLEISERCKKSQELLPAFRDDHPKSSSQVKEPHIQSTYFDNLDHLPPQLPYFLQDFRCA